VNKLLRTTPKGWSAEDMALRLEELGCRTKILETYKVKKLYVLVGGRWLWATYQGVKEP
jgi:hypothetical protein